MRERLHRMTRPHRIILLAALTGVLVGLAVAVFEQVVGHWLLEWTLELPTAVQCFAPAAGLVLAWVALRYIGRGATPSLSDEYLVAYHHQDGDLSPGPFAGKVSAAVATLGLGGACGFEGPSIYLGSSIGAFVRRRFPRTFAEGDRRVLVTAGAAAGVAAIFKAPATGAVFSLEVPYQEDSASHAVVPAIVAAAASYLTYIVFFGVERLFPIAGKPPLDTKDLLGALAMGLLAGVGARAFSAVLRSTKRFAAEVVAWKRIALCGGGLALTAAVTWAVYDRPLSLGPGYGAIDWTRDPTRALGLILLLLLIRAVATTCTLAGGGAGGVFIPLFVEGWLLGAAVEAVVNSHTMLFPVIGAAAFLGAGYRTPIAAIVFVAEVTGRPEFIVPALIATAVAQLVMGRWSVTKAQLERRLDPVQLRDRRLPVDVLDPVPDPLDAGAPRVPASATVGDVRYAINGSRAPYAVVVDGEAVLGVVTPAAILALEE